MIALKSMKGTHPRITLLGNNSGRNLGDAAIMSSILESLSKRLPNAEFLIPSINPSWIEKHYAHKYNLKAINVMPWTGSLRLLGIPTLCCLAKSDLALICDGIIFGKKLFNPAFNYLITLVPLVPLAKLLGCKVLCYSCGIGPFPSAISRLFAKWTISGCDTIMMRERDSESLCREIGVTNQIDMTADAAFINPASSEQRADEIITSLGLDPQKPLLAINATGYMDSWLPKDGRLKDSAGFLKMYGSAVKRALERVSEKFQVITISTHPMDEKASLELAQAAGGVLLTNSDYLSHDIQAVMRRCGLLLGMRFHSTVLASSVETPVVGLVYMPKVRGYLRYLECPDYALELKDLTEDFLTERLTQAWNERAALKARQVVMIRELKKRAELAADLVVERYYAQASRSGSAVGNG